MEQTSVLIVDAHPVLCEGLAVGLADAPDLSVVGAMTSPYRVLPFIEETRPRVVVIEDELVRDEGPLSLAAFARCNPSPSIVLIISEPDGETAASVLRADACAFVSKDAPLTELANAVRWAGRGERWVSPVLLRNLLDDSVRRGTERDGGDEWSSLTGREHEILLLLVEGFSHKEVAHRLDIALNTVRTHTRNIQIKLHVRSTLAAVSLAMSHGMRPHDLPV
jgi:two-component system, NarL family, response regulator NreC